MTRLPRLALALILPIALGCQGCLAVAVVGTAGSVAVGTAKLGTHVVAEGVRMAVPGETRAERRDRERRERQERRQARREAREAARQERR